jgi:uroporphyrinogen-III synthase
MRLLVTRPEPDASRQAKVLAERGHVPMLVPLLSIESIAEKPLDFNGAQALIVTSRNALRALASRVEFAEALHLPLFAVGEVTARDASALGFAKVITGLGTGEALADLIAATLDPGVGSLVHLSGETVAFDLKSALEAKGFIVRQAVLYRSVPASELPQEALSLLKAGKLDGVILMSPRTAATFVDLVRRHGLVTQASRLVCYCLSGAVAKAAEPLGSRVVVAANPREEDVLALISAEAASS